MLEKHNAAQPNMLAGIPSDTAGIGGITVSRPTNITGIMRISYNELQAIQSAVPALQGLFMQLMMSAAMSGAAGGPLGNIGTDDAQESAANASAACMLNLHLISVAKEMHAGQPESNANHAPTLDELKPFLKTGNPECPLGGVYSINAPGINPTCSLPGHSLSID